MIGSSKDLGVLNRGAGDRRTAIARIACGGCGVRTENLLRKLYPELKVSGLSFDTDPRWTPDVRLQLTEAKLEAIKLHLRGFESRRNQSKKSPVANKIIRQLSARLNGDDMANGSKTTRAITQLVYLYHRKSIWKSVRKLIERTKKASGKRNVGLLITCTEGGGTGSALSNLLAKDLLNPQVMSFVYKNAEKVTRPMMYVASPFAYADDSEADQRAKILSNSLAHRIESDELLKKGIQGVFHLGFENDADVVLDDGEEMISVFADCIFEFISSYDQIKAKLVDGCDNDTRIDHDAFYLPPNNEKGGHDAT